MNGWQQLTTIGAGAASVLAIVFLVLWLTTRRSLSRLTSSASESEWSRIDRELSLAEQAGRLRIIRELQDVAIQSVTRLVSQADAVRYSIAGDPEVALRSTALLATQARDALGDMRRVMTVVREGESVSMPQPGLQSARDLFRVMRDAGLDVTFDESGDSFELKPGAELAVFRILQGALENSLTHGGEGTNVRVGFSWQADGLQVTVDDDGIRSAARRAGLSQDELAQQTQYTIEDDLRALTERINGAGISEMRERAELFGGVLTAKTVPGIGFSILAVFPSLRFHNGVHAVNLTR
jgi:signal transduction histidine kinase